MFWFHHPRPPNRKEVAEQIVARKTAAAPNMHVLIVERSPPVDAAKPAALPAAETDV